MSSRPCTAICADGSPCKAWAVRGSDPARCAAHGGGCRPVGAPPGNANALRHGYYALQDLPDDCTIDAVIDMLYHKQLALDDFIDQILAIGRPALEELAHLLKIHGQNASRLGRVLRDRRALSGDTADEDGRYTAGFLHLRRGGLNAAWQAAKGTRSGHEANAWVKARLQTHRRALAERSSAGLHEDHTTPPELMPAVLGVGENCQADESAEHLFESPSQMVQEPFRRPSAENRGNRPSIRREAPRNASGGAAFFRPDLKGRLPGGSLWEASACGYIR